MLTFSTMILPNQQAQFASIAHFLGDALLYSVIFVSSAKEIILICSTTLLTYEYSFRAQCRRSRTCCCSHAEASFQLQRLTRKREPNWMMLFHPLGTPTPSCQSWCYLSQAHSGLQVLLQCAIPTLHKTVGEISMTQGLSSISQYKISPLKDWSFDLECRRRVG